MNNEVTDFIKLAADASHYLTAALAGSLLAGGAGGILASRGGNRPGEDDNERRKRILSNALAMGTLGAVAGAGGVGAYDAFSHAAPERTANEDFLLATNPTTRVAVGAGAGGAAGLGLEFSAHKANDSFVGRRATAAAEKSIEAMARGNGIPIVRDKVKGWVQDMLHNPTKLNPKALAAAQLEGEKALAKFRSAAAAAKAKTLTARTMMNPVSAKGIGAGAIAGGLAGYFAPDLTGIMSSGTTGGMPSSE